MTLVDTSVILDLVTRDPAWFDWSFHQMEAAALRGRLYINAVIYAELSVRYDAIGELERMLSTAGLHVETIPHPALFLAGKAFGRYRARGGHRGTILPDFLIGAHALTLARPLLTRDPRRFASYFPGITLIAP